jgi:hypothetical protein
MYENRLKGLVIVDFSSLFKTRLRSSFPSSQLRFEVRKLGGNFAANFRTSKRTSELRNELPKFNRQSWCEICNGVRRTDGFLRKYRTKIGKESYEIITNTLRDNFTSRLSSKLLDPENLDVYLPKVNCLWNLEKFLTTTGICCAMNRRYQSLNHSEPIPQVKKVQLTQSQR